jgi:hypothetical protein
MHGQGKFFAERLHSPFFTGIIAGFAFAKGRKYLPNLKRCEWFAA